MLTDDEGRTLVRLARAAIEDRLRRDRTLERVLAATALTAGIEERRAAFVTLKTRCVGVTAALRGCIGSMETDLALYRNVIETAPRAALLDPRFPPLDVAELERVHVEVSALTRLEPLASIEDLVLGRDGVQLDDGTRRAVFLPQVGAERDWSVEEFLAQLALKAGINRSGWRRASLSVFRAEVFRE